MYTRGAYIAKCGWLPEAFIGTGVPYDLEHNLLNRLRSRTKELALLFDSLWESKSKQESKGKG